MSALRSGNAALHQALGDGQNGRAIGHPAKDLSHELGLLRYNLDAATVRTLSWNPTVSVGRVGHDQNATLELV